MRKTLALLFALVLACNANTCLDPGSEDMSVSQQDTSREVIHIKPQEMHGLCGSPSGNWNDASLDVDDVMRCDGSIIVSCVAWFSLPERGWRFAKLTTDLEWFLEGDSSIVMSLSPNSDERMVIQAPSTSGGRISITKIMTLSRGRNDYTIRVRGACDFARDAYIKAMIRGIDVERASEM